MPTLPISDGQGQSPADLPLIVYSICRFPRVDEENERAEFLRIKSLQAQVANAPEDRLVQIPAGDLQTLTFSSPPPEDLSGLFAAQILRINLVCHQCHPELVGAKRAADFAARTAGKSLSAVFKYWSRFKTVSHLWLGMWEAQRLFPKAPFEVTLALSELFRQQGERIFAHGGRAKEQALLDPSKTWKVPRDIALPSVGEPLNFEPLPPEAVADLKRYSPSRG